MKTQSGRKRTAKARKNLLDKIHGLRCPRLEPIGKSGLSQSQLSRDLRRLQIYCLPRTQRKKPSGAIGSWTRCVTARRNCVSLGTAETRRRNLNKRKDFCSTAFWLPDRVSAIVHLNKPRFSGDLAGMTLALIGNPVLYDVAAKALNSALDSSFANNPIWGPAAPDRVFTRRQLTPSRSRRKRKAGKRRPSASPLESVEDAAQ